MTKIRTDGSAVKQLIASDRDPETADPACGAGSYRSRDGGGAGRGEARLGYRSGYYTRSLITRGEGAAGPSGAVLDRAVQRYQRSEKALVAALAFGHQS